MPHTERLSAYSQILACYRLAEPVRSSWLAFEGAPGARIRLAPLASCKRSSLRSSFAFETFIMAGGWLHFDNAQCLFQGERAAPVPGKRSAQAPASAASR